MKLFIATLFTLITLNAHALGPLYLDFHGGAGGGSAKIEDESKSPSMIQYSAGATLGYKLIFMYLGVSADYYKVNQLTEPDDQFGNRGGTRTNILSPTLGLDLLVLRLKFDYQMNGKYDLDKKTEAGEKVSYEDPKGFRIYAGFKIFPMIEIGAFHETVTYETEVTGDLSRELDKKLNISQTGIMLSIVL